MLKVMDANTTTTTNGGCEHEPPAVILDATGRGYRIRCLSCGALGPQREDPGSGWADLEGWRYPEANPARRTSLY